MHGSRDGVEVRSGVRTQVAVKLEFEVSLKDFRDASVDEDRSGEKANHGLDLVRALDDLGSGNNDIKRKERN